MVFESKIYQIQLLKELIVPKMNDSYKKLENNFQQKEEETMYFQSTRPMRHQDLIKEMKAYKKDFGENHFTEDSLSLILDSYYPEKEEGREVLTFIGPKDLGYLCMDREESDKILAGKSMHRHNFYELMYVADGSVYQNIEHTRHLYPKGSCCLMNMNIRHLEEFDEHCRVIFLEFTQEYILNLLQFPSVFTGKCTQEYEMVRKFFLHELDKEEASQRAYIDFIPMKETRVVHDCSDKIAVGLQERTPKSNFQIAGAMIEMLSALFDKEIYTNTPVAFGNTSERELFDQITSYIREKDGQVRRKDLEKKFSYSGDYLYKTVEKYTGLSLYEYSTKFTMEKVGELLLDSDLTVAEIMERFGFSNRTQFYRLFQRNYGMTPREYRKSQFQ